MSIPLSRYKQSLIKKEDKPYDEKKLLVCNSLYFDGIDDYVNCGNDPNLYSTDAITISVWIKTDVLDLSSHYIVNFDSNGQMCLNIHTNNKICAIIYTPDGWKEIYSNAILLIDKWYHVAITYKTGVGGKIYQDGQESGSELGNFGNITYSDTKRLDIGQYYSGIFKFNGSIANVQIYNRALSKTEVLNLYKNKNTSDKGLVLDLPMTSDYSNKKIIQDKSDYNNDGILHGCKWNCNRIKKHAI